MAAKCKKCDPHEICEECPEWIFTLADLIMCMMGLFVLLWVLKPSPTPPALGAAEGEPNKQQIRQTEVLAEIQAAFGYVPNPNSTDPIDTYLLQKEKMRLVGPGERGKQEVPEPAAEGTDPQVQTIREGKLSPIGTRVAFDRGDAALRPEGTRTLNQITREIIGMQFVVVIKGHAARDDFDQNATAQQLMDVSLRRAQAVADYLVTRGVSPDVLRVQGCSTYEPVRQRAYTPEAQRLNRRVEIYSTDLLVRDLQDPNDPSGKPLE